METAGAGVEDDTVVPVSQGGRTVAYEGSGVADGEHIGRRTSVIILYPERDRPGFLLLLDQQPIAAERGFAVRKHHQVRLVVPGIVGGDQHLFPVRVEDECGRTVHVQAPVGIQVAGHDHLAACMIDRARYRGVTVVGNREYINWRAAIVVLYPEGKGAGFLFLLDQQGVTGRVRFPVGDDYQVGVIVAAVQCRNPYLVTVFRQRKGGGLLHAQASRHVHVPAEAHLGGTGLDDLLVGHGKGSAGDVDSRLGVDVPAETHLGTADLVHGTGSGYIGTAQVPSGQVGRAVGQGGRLDRGVGVEGVVSRVNHLDVDPLGLVGRFIGEADLDGPDGAGGG